LVNPADSRKKETRMNISGDHIDMVVKANQLTALSQRKKYGASCTTYKQKGTPLNINNYHQSLTKISVRWGKRKIYAGSVLDCQRIFYYGFILDKIKL
jgi:hypothetical protein